MQPPEYVSKKHENPEESVNIIGHATSSHFEMLLEFYVLRNYMEPERAVSESKDQRFNGFLKDARDYLEGKGCKVLDNYKFRQVVDTFYEEAEFE